MIPPDRRPMIFTIGHRETYLVNLKKPGFKKLGRCEDYRGGYAFLTRADAQERINEAYGNEDYAIYGLVADWERDTVPAYNGWWHYLLVDSKIVNLEPEPPK